MNGPVPGMAKTIWSGMEGAALAWRFVSTIASRSEPGPESLVLVTTNWSVLARSLENSDVSPVLRFVAVALTRLPNRSAPGPRC